MQVEKHVIGTIFIDLELEVIPTGTGGGVPGNGGQEGGGWKSFAK